MFCVKMLVLNKMVIFVCINLFHTLRNVWVGSVCFNRFYLLHAVFHQDISTHN